MSGDDKKPALDPALEETGLTLDPDALNTLDVSTEEDPRPEVSSDTWTEASDMARPTPLGRKPVVLPDFDDDPDTELIDDVEKPGRYQLLERLGKGGMGEVWRVRDRELKRSVAMKVLKPRLLSNPRTQARFREEAQVAGQLQHPGIVPVHDLGTLPDGRIYFTMKEVKGRTFDQPVEDALNALLEGEDGPIQFRRAMGLFHRVCETVAYAHARGVVHRDLKPANIMVGDFGEVLVLDWGLAKVLQEESTDPLREADPGDSIESGRNSNDSLQTRVGAVTGTPAYMAPEQARGQNHLVGPSTDVYALGGILYVMLAGRPARLAKSARDLLDKVIACEAFPPPSESDFEVDPTLEAICLRSLADQQADRFPHAGALAAEVALWLDGAQKRARALEVVARAKQLVPTIAEHETRAEALRVEAVAAMDGVERYDPEEQKWPAWEKEDEADRLEREARSQRVALIQGLQGALTHAPDLREAHDLLAAQYHAQHLEAESGGNTRAADAVLPYLRAHNRSGDFDAYLKGEGAVTLVTEPAGATVEVYRYVERRRRLVPEFVKTVGPTPLFEVPLPMGSYLLIVKAPGHIDVRYPVLVGRMEHWDGIRPGSSAPYPIVLPKRGELAEDDCYIPAGWFWSGTETESTIPLPIRRLWCDAAVFKKYPVTNAEYVEFLNWLLENGRDDEAKERVPQSSGGEACFNLENDKYHLGKDPEGHEWLPTVPVVKLRHSDAVSYSTFRKIQDGVSWRLPFELEWAKAARGVDRRRFPWGNYAETTWARMVLSSKNDGDGPTTVLDYPVDESVFGVRQMSGQAMEWLLDPYPMGSGANPIVQVGISDFEPSYYRFLRGGSWNSPWFNCRLDQRKVSPALVRWDANGTRLARTLDHRQIHSEKI